jgi:replicative DNA helicase
LKPTIRAVPNCTGRVPPHDLDAEAAVLSASLLSASALGRAVEILTHEHFYSEAHRRVSEAAMGLHEASTPADLITVASWLKDRDRLAQVGGMPYLHQILGAAPSLGPAEGYTDVGDLEAFLDDAESRIHQATSSTGKAKTVQTMRAAAKGAFAKIQAYAARASTP